MALDRDGAPQCTTFPTEEGETAIRRSPAIVAPTSSAIMYGITSFAGIFFPNSSPIVTAGLRAPTEIPIVMEIPIARPARLLEQQQGALIQDRIRPHTGWRQPSLLRQRRK